MKGWVKPASLDGVTGNCSWVPAESDPVHGMDLASRTGPGGKSQGRWGWGVAALALTHSSHNCETSAEYPI